VIDYQYDSVLLDGPTTSTATTASGMKRLSPEPQVDRLRILWLLALTFVNVRRSRAFRFLLNRIQGVKFAAAPTEVRLVGGRDLENLTKLAFGDAIRVLLDSAGPDRV
jgi:hypothetical protein